jgi:phage terminase small subunit
VRGRKPKPTALKILAGDQPCRINTREPIIPGAGAPDPPAWLGNFGVDIWKRLAPVLASAGLLSLGDVPAFEQLCDEYDTIRRDPLNSAARDRYRRLLVEFGLTPSSRSRIKSTVEPPKDKMAEFLAKQAGRKA